MYEITNTPTFAAAHAIRLYDGSREALHGHNWTVEVTVAAAELDRIELVMDFHKLERLVDRLMGQVDNRNLNDIPPFAGAAPAAGGAASSGASGEAAAARGGGVNPTAERVAWWLGSELAKVLPRRVRLVGVRVGEAPGCVATWRP